MQRYIETREESEVILRLALAFMGQQKAAFTPHFFELAYQHIAGINPALTRALNERLDPKAPLVDAEVRRLYSRYIEFRDLEASERAHAELTNLVRDTAGTIAAARTKVARYKASLDEKTGRLTDPEATPAETQGLLVALGHETQALLAAMHSLVLEVEARAGDLRKLGEQLSSPQALALIDPLTGLKNRRGLELAVDVLAEAGNQLEGSALILGDVDHFKTINDSHGHLAGDKVLRAVAAVLQASVKGRDIAARVGGEEFVALLPGTSLVGATALAEQIRGLVSRLKFPLTGSDDPFGVTMSLGVAAAHSGESLEDFLARADAAMYAGKRGGRDRVCVATERTA